MKENSLLIARGTTSACGSIPDQVCWLRLKTAFADTSGIHPTPRYTAHQGLLQLLLPDSLMPSGKAFLTPKKCKVWFSYNSLRSSVTTCTEGAWWFIAAHSAPREVSEADAKSLQAIIGLRTLEAVLIAKAACFPEKSTGSPSSRRSLFCGRVWHLRNILNTGIVSQ